MNPLNPVYAVLAACALLTACGPKPGEPAAPAAVQHPENSLNGSTPVPDAPVVTDPAAK
jgi:hypothetical protein